MDDNQLGRNIQHLRIIHNETLDELGSIHGGHLHGGALRHCFAGGGATETGNGRRYQQ